MVFQRINRTDPEKVFVIVRNDYSTAALTVGQVAQWNFGATTPDGVGVTRPTARATNAGMAAAGAIASASIPYNGYGLLQVYGYHSALRVRVVTGGSPTFAPGRPLALPVAGGVFCAETISTASNVILRYPFAFGLGSATSVFTTATKAAFIKAM